MVANSGGEATDRLYPPGGTGVKFRRNSFRRAIIKL